MIRFNILSWFATTWSQQHRRDEYILRKELSLRGAVQFTDGTGWTMVMTCIHLFRAAPLVFQPVVSLRVIKFMKSLWFGWQDVVRRVINICIVPVLSWPPTIWLCNGHPTTSRSSARRRNDIVCYFLRTTSKWLFKFLICGAERRVVASRRWQWYQVIFSENFLVPHLWRWEKGFAAFLGVPREFNMN